MTRCEDQTTVTQTGTTRCDCEGCRSGDLPVNPFVALRVAYGMLLGEQDFRDLMGNPRGKHMLHNAWLHGAGVVWGYDVGRDGVRNLKIGPGLALDGIGRELVNEATTCIDLTGLVAATQPENRDECGTRTIDTCLVAEFDSCLSDARPTLADPCDVTRKHDDYSRVTERVRFDLRKGWCAETRCCGYYRVRVLLGLERPDGSEAAREAVAAGKVVLAALPQERPRELLHQFRRLAALDTIDLEPALEPGDCFPTLFPVADDMCAVALACVRITVRERDGCPEIEDVEIDCTCRTALLPTCAIQDLTCALAPGVLGDSDHADAGGPRVIGSEIVLDDDGLRMTIPVTKPLAAGSVPGSVRITSLSADGPGGWVVEDLYETTFDAEQHAIVVRLADSPVNELIRVVVEGTGRKPVMGADPLVPLAGVVDGPPGTKFDGHDAVWMLPNPAPRGRRPAPAEAAADTEAEANESDDGTEAGQ